MTNKCDGGRPECSNCKRAPARFGVCSYSGENQEREQSDRGGSSADDNPVFLHNPYGEGHGGSATTDIPSIQTLEEILSDPQLRQTLLSGFLEYSADVGFFLDEEEFFNSVMTLNTSHPATPTVPALVSIVFLIASHFTPYPQIASLEPVLLRKAKEQRSHLLLGIDNNRPRWTVLQNIQTHVLFAQYFIVTGCNAEGKDSLANAVSLLLSARMHRIGSEEQPAFVASGPTEGSSQASKEYSQSISAFWTVLSLNSCWTAVETEDSKTHFPYWMPEFRVDTPWPQVPLAVSSGSTIQKFLVHVPDNGNSAKALHAKACILLEQASQVGTRYDPNTALDTSSHRDFRSILDNLLSLTTHFIAELPRIPSNQQAEHGVHGPLSSSTKRQLLVIHTLARMALIRIYSISELINYSDPNQTAAAYHGQVEAAKDAASMIPSADLQQTTFMNPIMAVIWSSMAHILFTSSRQSGEQSAQHNFGFIQTDLHHAFKIILDALSVLSAHSLAMRASTYEYPTPPPVANLFPSWWHGYKSAEDGVGRVQGLKRVSSGDARKYAFYALKRGPISMAPSDFAKANIDEVVEKLTMEEAISLIAGVGFWHTASVERLGIPAVKTSDGPNGIRGNHFFMSTPAKCLPSATALGATFDTELIEIVGRDLLGPEAKAKAASILLGPTCNIQRNPLGGRSFESFSEDPYLSGMIAAAYVKGVQTAGIGVAIKHFVGNDKENDRMAYDSIMSERALREIYLMPFMLAEKYVKPWSYMTAYNRVNGTHVSEHPCILQRILRGEWGFQGMTMSDWFGIYSIDHSINAGLDLEMPGTNKWRTLDLVSRSIGSRKVTLRTVKERARKVLELVKRCAQECPEILDGDGIERTLKDPAHERLMHQVATQSIVLLKNETELLPLKPQDLKKIAIVGGNAQAVVLSGGGSAALKPSYFISPYQGIVDCLKQSNPDVQIDFCEGARTYMNLPTLETMLTVEKDGQKEGWTVRWFKHKSDESMVSLDEPLAGQDRFVDETRIFISTSYPAELTRRWTLKLQGWLKPQEKDVEWEFGLTSAGRAKLFIDGALVIDNWTTQRRGDAFFGQGSQEDKGVFTLKAGVAHEVEVVYCNVRAPAPEDGDPDELVMDSNPGVRLGGAPVVDSDTLMDQAVSIAKEADAVIAVVGLNADWETEGYDRTTLALPGRTDELVEKVVAANKSTVVVVQSGSSVVTPWASSVPSIVHAWYLGNETGAAIADVLFGKCRHVVIRHGKVNPSGKMSLTFPKRMEDLPTYGHFGSEGGKVRYAENLYVGYRHYHHLKIAPEFPFGHGLSYTTFSLSSLVLSTPIISHEAKEFQVKATLKIKNTGTIPGSEVVQFYVGLPPNAEEKEISHPLWQLRAFTKVKDLKPGEEREVGVTLDKYAVSWWDESRPGWNMGKGCWVVDKGVYKVKVGVSSVDFRLEGEVKVDKGFEWNGL
ncbi:hypothetical protein D9758_010946 [Tetrapyrgos nigripes]|uniref:beta-glucosidase n=1 Tax=Tetrapyrgos nigripes TaxID=182062 RepID=A0A8H5CVI6_9AGAR|nr:hypothetical protein D9758_010946 [Tetrapyrgos nigripes]